MLQPFFYRIENMLADDGDMSGCGFSICLSAEAAAYCAQQILPRDVKVSIREDLRQRLGHIWGPAQLAGVHVLWWKDTWLPTGLQVPGEACQLGADANAIEDAAAGKLDLFYRDHNVDRPEQALGLLVLWTAWAQMVAAYAQAQAFDVGQASKQG